MIWFVDFLFVDVNVIVGDDFGCECLCFKELCMLELFINVKFGGGVGYFVVLKLVCLKVCWLD